MVTEPPHLNRSYNQTIDTPINKPAKNTKQAIHKKRKRTPARNAGKTSNLIQNYRNAKLNEKEIHFLKIYHLCAKTE